MLPLFLLSSPTVLSPLQIIFRKVFNGCPLKINCSTTWEHPTTKGMQLIKLLLTAPSCFWLHAPTPLHWAFLDQHLIFGADAGIFMLNLNGAEATMELVSMPSDCAVYSTLLNFIQAIHSL